MDVPPPTAAAKKLLEQLRKESLSYPEAWEDHPWGHVVFKVGKKVFIILGWGGPRVNVTLKLPWQAEQALELPGAERTGYGLGNHNWVTLAYGSGSGLPFKRLRTFIEESYRAIAPKKLSKKLDEAAGEA